MPAPCHFEENRRSRNRGRLRSINAHDERKRIELRRDGHSEKDRNPTVVLTAGGGVHTYEEAQVFVHDLNQFVTVQPVEETLAVLSVVKLCEDHGYSIEWVTKNGKIIFCTTDNFIHLVVPGLSVNSGSGSSFLHRHHMILQIQHWSAVMDWLQEMVMTPHL